MLFFLSYRHKKFKGNIYGKYLRVEMEPYQFIGRLPNSVRWILMPIITFISFFAVNMLLKFLIKLNRIMMPDTILFFIPTEYFFIFEEHLVTAFIVGATPLIVGASIAPSYKIIVTIILSAIMFMIVGVSLMTFYYSENWISLINVISTMLGVGWAIFYILNKINKIENSHKLDE